MQNKTTICDPESRTRDYMYLYYIPPSSYKVQRKIKQGKKLCTQVSVKDSY